MGLIGARSYISRAAHSLFNAVTSRLSTISSYSNPRSSPASEEEEAIPSVVSNSMPSYVMKIDGAGTKHQPHSATNDTKDPKAQNGNEAGQRKPRLFALLIGINTYNGSQNTSGLRAGSETHKAANHTDLPTFNNLRGAVADAEDFQRYLIDIGVPSHRITFLGDTNATRANIIQAFQNLANDSNIISGDSIFIFYAGHGAQAYPPERLKGAKGCPERVELIVPYDYKRDPTNHQRMGIPDYTLAALLNQIAEKKGNNITLVFDCCHAASALRGGAHSPDSQTITRALPELNYAVPDDLDEDIWGGKRAMIILPTLKHLGARSYVFFSACASAEFAKEKENRGCFTLALLKLLRDLGPSAIPCSQIVTRLPKLDGQSPQCEGFHQDRFIFHGYLPSYKKKFFNIYEAPRSHDQFTMSEGEAHGFSKGDELTVYRSKSEDDQKSPVGTVIIEGFNLGGGASTSRLKPGPNVPTPFRLPCNPAPALLTKSAEVKLKVHIDSAHDALISRINRLSIDGVVMSSRSAAHVSISIVSGANPEERLCFEVVDKDVLRQNLRLKPRFARDDDEDLASILQGLAHYYWHLKRNNKSLPLERFSVSFVQLDDTYREHHRFIQKEGSHSLCDDSNVVDIEVNEDNIYGLEIADTTRQGGNLFPVLFYFDNTEFTITPAYEHSVTGNNPECPWVGPSMTIGYGVGAGSATPPFSFYMDKAYDTEVGFFKLVLSNKPISLESMAQVESPFMRSRGMKQNVSQLPPVTHQWGSITLTVITRRNV